MFRVDSRVEPLVDGQESFRRLVLDLDEARSVTLAGTPLGAHFTGLFIMDFPMVAGREDTKLSAYADAFVGNSGSILVLPDKIVNLRDPNVSTLRLAAILVLYALTDVLIFIIALESLPTDGRAAAILFFAVTGIAFALATLQLSETAFEKSQPALDVLNEGRPVPVAIYSRPPMTLDDNPLTPPTQLYSLEDDFNQPGFWHAKAQLVKRSATAGPESHVAFVGGIDVNPNRLDTPSHQISGPFHDVHARVSGPIVVDAFESFRERWEHDARAAYADTGTSRDCAGRCRLHAESEPPHRTHRTDVLRPAPWPAGAPDLCPQRRAHHLRDAHPRHRSSARSHLHRGSVPSRRTTSSSTRSWPPAVSAAGWSS